MPRSTLLDIFRLHGACPHGHGRPALWIAAVGALVDEGNSVLNSIVHLALGSVTMMHSRPRAATDGLHSALNWGFLAIGAHWLQLNAIVLGIVAPVVP